LPHIAIAQSNWEPMMIVNTESFGLIREGDGTTDVEVRFGGTLNEKLLFNRTKSTFQFTDDLSVQGNLSGSTLRIDGYADIWGSLSASGSIQADQNITAGNRLSGALLQISGPAEIKGALSASGSFRTDSDVSINDDRTAADAVLTFGNATTNQTLKYLNTAQKFEFSKDLKVIGNLSGSTLNVDGTATINGAAAIKGALTASGNVILEGNLTGSTITGFGLPAGGCTGTTRKLVWNAATSKFECAADETGTIGNGSGLILSLHPEYANSVYFSSGATFVGQLSGSGGTSGLNNSYVWTSTKAALQDYWVAIRVRVPDNFSSWDIVKPIEFRYKTGVASAAANHLTVRMKDTAGADVALTSGGGLASTTWATANVTGPQAGGTWTPKGYFTVYVKLAANSTAGANAAASFLNLNFETTTP
jgi:cytoskeletal protein CcmA (bactofilin family)